MQLIQSVKLLVEGNGLVGNVRSIRRFMTNVKLYCTTPKCIERQVLEKEERCTLSCK